VIFNHLPILSSNGRHVMLAVATIFAAIAFFACSDAPQHPPTFADFQRLGPGVLEDEKKLMAQVAVFEAAMFLPQDIELIQAKGNVRELIGILLQTRSGDGGIPALIGEALRGGSNDPVVLTGIAACLEREIANRQGPLGGHADLRDILATLEQLEPDNGLPLCLRAHLQLKEGDTNSARLSVQAAARKPALRLYGSELRRCVIQAAITAKYPRYTASMMAIGTPGVSSYITIVSKLVLNDAELDRETAEACLELGRRQEAQSKLFIEQLMAFSLQKRALEFLKPPGFDQELQRMKEEKDKITSAIAFLDSRKAHSATERQWLAYFDTLFAESETQAVNELAAKLNYKL
jgi:hypothetical protein